MSPEVQLSPEARLPIAEWGSNYVFWSFYFSQGDADTQRQFAFYANNKFPASCEALKGHIDAVIDASTLKLNRFLSVTANHIQVNQQYNEDIASDAVKEFIEPQLYIYEYLRYRFRPMDIIKLMIERERVLLGILQGPEYKRLTNRRVDLRADPENKRFGRSILLEHLVDGKDGRHEVFRKLFQDMRCEVLHTDGVPEALHVLAEREAELRGVPPRDIGAFLLGLESQKS